MRAARGCRAVRLARLCTPHPLVRPPAALPRAQKHTDRRVLVQYLPISSSGWRVRRWGAACRVPGLLRCASFRKLSWPLLPEPPLPRPPCHLLPALLAPRRQWVNPQDLEAFEGNTGGWRTCVPCVQGRRLAGCSWGFGLPCRAECCNRRGRLLPAPLRHGSPAALRHLLINTRALHAGAAREREAGELIKSNGGRWKKGEEMVRALKVGPPARRPSSLPASAPMAAPPARSPWPRRTRRPCAATRLLLPAETPPPPPKQDARASLWVKQHRDCLEADRMRRTRAAAAAGAINLKQRCGQCKTCMNNFAGGRVGRR